MLRRGVDDDATVVALARDATSPTSCKRSSTTLGLGMRGRVEMQRGTMDEFVAWEPVLRALIDGRPVHEPGMVQLRDADGTISTCTRASRSTIRASEIGALPRRRPAS